MSGTNTRLTGYFGKMSGGAPTAGASNLRESMISGIGGLLGIGVCSYLSIVSGYPWLTAPFGATSVLIFAVHKTPLAQPRNVVGGYVISALSGLIIQAMLGNAWWTPPVGVGLAIAGMALAKMLHAPAGGVPIVIITSRANWLFLFRPVLIGSVALVLVAALYNNLFDERRYPEYWW